jgi:predicted amidohydrolase
MRHKVHQVSCTLALDTMIFAAVQMTSQGDVDENLARVATLVAQAAARGARVVVLPENFAYMGKEEGRRAVSEPIESDQRGRIATSVARAAADNGVYVIAGGMPERGPDADHPYNTCAVMAPDGSVVAKYRKIHLFDVDVGDGQKYRESASTTAGDQPVSCQIGRLCVGLSVCYDIRFPELYRAYADVGADVLVVPAAFTAATGKCHWDVLVRARAIESQAYVVAAAQWGTHPHGRQTYGHSAIVDPWGEVLAQLQEGEGIVTADIDPSRIEAVRGNLPALRHRRIRS